VPLAIARTARASATPPWSEATSAAPAFREIMRFALQYLDAPPDMPDAAATEAAPPGTTEPAPVETVPGETP
jgi:hypothetical protein